MISPLSRWTSFLSLLLPFRAIFVLTSKILDTERTHTSHLPICFCSCYCSCFCCSLAIPLLLSISFHPTALLFSCPRWSSICGAVFLSCPWGYGRLMYIVLCWRLDNALALASGLTSFGALRSSWGWEKFLTGPGLDGVWFNCNTLCSCIPRDGVYCSISQGRPCMMYAYMK